MNVKSIQNNKARASREILKNKEWRGRRSGEVKAGSVIKTVSYWSKNTDRSWNRIENPEKEPTALEVWDTIKVSWGKTL